MYYYYVALVVMGVVGVISPVPNTNNRKNRSVRTMYVSAKTVNVRGATMRKNKLWLALYLFAILGYLNWIHNFIDGNNFFIVLGCIFGLDLCLYKAYYHWKNIEKGK